jgi:Tfp pilus assembly protein PilF
LIEKGLHDEAIFYLKRATRAKNYNTYCYPYYNLSRVWIKRGKLNKAIASLYKALEANPRFAPAINTLNHLSKQVN